MGASLKEDRYSNIVIKRLLKHNNDVVAFGLREGQVDDVTIVTVLSSYKHIDTVTLYLSPKHQNLYYEYIIGLNPNRVIFNPGTENVDFQQLLKEQNIYFEEACTLVLLGTNQY